MSGSTGGDGGVPDQFTGGLRLHVVDDVSTCLMVLENMLRQCNYEVTKCNRPEVALSYLRENKNGFDVVLSDVHMPDMDGSKLLEHIGLEMDLPSIMIPADDSRSVVIRGVTHGACDYLTKPLRIEALSNIWHHVVRKRKHEWKDFDQSASTRVVWSLELHQKFVAVVNQLGIDRLTRENVSSHLQKYRLYLRRLSRSQLPGRMNKGLMGGSDAGLGSTSSLNGLDQFPAGLRVLVVDDDSACLMILEKMLKHCNYEVTKCNRAEVALSILRKNKNRFDIVMSEVHMPNMDGFKLLEHIGLEMDLPVIMMSADSSNSVVMKGITRGACDYLIKPISIEVLRNISHVVRKRKQEWKDFVAFSKL